jgi:hypothetical protein
MPFLGAAALHLPPRKNAFRNGSNLPCMHYSYSFLIVCARDAIPRYSPLTSSGIMVTNLYLGMATCSFVQ